MTDESWVSIDGDWVMVTSHVVYEHANLDARDAPDSHPLETVTGLVDALATKSAANHTHPYTTFTVSATAPANPRVGDLWLVP